MMQRAAHFLQKEPILWGPISLLCTVALAVKGAIPFELLFVAVIGFFLSARMLIRGACYALILLTLVSGFRHLFLVSDHLWQLGIESSLGCAFLITALAFAQGAEWIQSLEIQMQNGRSSLNHLEEELTKIQQGSQEQQIFAQEKLDCVQKELEDLQTEYSSLLILNEVLRKTTAQQIQEQETLRFSLRDMRRQTELLQNELENSEKEVVRLKNSDAIVMQNRALIADLNQARYDREQTHLINETLARLHYNERLKAKEADEEASALHEQLLVSRQQIKWLESEFEKANLEANRIREELLHFRQTQTERKILQEKLQAAEAEIAQLQTRQTLDPAQITELKQDLQKAEAKVAQIEPLYKQLKKQFAEKNQTLHQARSDFFKADTELQTLQMEKAAFDLQALPKEVEQELENLSEQIGDLEEENQELLDLVTTLIDTPSDSLARKKKGKMKPVFPEQELLF